MSGEIEVFQDADGVVVTGERSAVDRFLAHMGLTPNDNQPQTRRLSTYLRAAAGAVKTASHIAEQSTLYLKLTPESAQKLKDAGGLMPTKSEGISYAMLGVPGQVGGWLQVENGPASALSNPAVLSGIGSLMSQFAQLSEADDLHALLVNIDHKLDQVQRTQRDEVVARLHGAAAAIEDAITIRRHGGDAQTLWSKVDGESAVLHEVQSDALLKLAALAEAAAHATSPAAAKKAARNIEQQAGVQVAILARCFELQDQFSVLELDHVLETAPDKVDGHRLGLADARRRRRDEVLARTSELLEQLQDAGGVASRNVVLHARAARATLSAINGTAELIDELRAPLGIEPQHVAMQLTSWRDAVRDPQQLKAAGGEVAKKGLAAGGAAVAIAATKGAAKSRS